MKTTSRHLEIAALPLAIQTEKKTIHTRGHTQTKNQTRTSRRTKRKQDASHERGTERMWKREPRREKYDNRGRDGGILRPTTREEKTQEEQGRVRIT